VRCWNDDKLSQLKAQFAPPHRILRRHSHEDRKNYAAAAAIASRADRLWPDVKPHMSGRGVDAVEFDSYNPIRKNWAIFNDFLVLKPKAALALSIKKKPLVGVQAEAGSRLLSVRVLLRALTSVRTVRVIGRAGYYFGESRLCAY